MRRGGFPGRPPLLGGGMRGMPPRPGFGGPQMGMNRMGFGGRPQFGVLGAPPGRGGPPRGPPNRINMPGKAPTPKPADPKAPSKTAPKPGTSTITQPKQPVVHPSRMALRQGGAPQNNVLGRAQNNVLGRGPNNRGPTNGQQNKTPGMPGAPSPGLKRNAPASNSAGDQGNKRMRGPLGLASGPPTPQLIALRGELTGLLQKVPANELATVCSAAVNGAVRPITDATPGQHVEATYETITRFLGLRKEQLGMFKQRVCSKMHQDMVAFMEKTYQRELSQLLIASTTNQPTPHHILLRNRAMQVVQTADQMALLAMRAEIQKLEQARLNPPAPTPAAQPAAAPAPAPVVVAPPNPQQEQMLADAALTGDLATVQTLLAQGVNVNAARQGGWTALMNATLQGHAPVVTALIAAKSDLNIKDRGGFTALMYACSYSRVGIAEALVQAGADTTAVDNAGRSITDYAQDPAVAAAIARGKSPAAPAAAPVATAAPVAPVAAVQPQQQWGQPAQAQQQWQQQPQAAAQPQVQYGQYRGMTPGQPVVQNPAALWGR